MLSHCTNLERGACVFVILLSSNFHFLFLFSFAEGSIMFCLLFLLRDFFRQRLYSTVQDNECVYSLYSLQ